MHRADAGQSSLSTCMAPRTSAPSSSRWVVNLHRGSVDDASSELLDGSTTTTGSDDPTPDTLFSAPVVDADRGVLMYLRSFRGVGHSTLLALDATSGALLWNATIQGSRDVYGSYPTGLLLSDGSIVVTTLGGITRVHADGSIAWQNSAQTYLLADVFLSPSGNVIVAAPETCGGAPLRADGSTPKYPSLFGLDVDTGALVWGVMYPIAESDFCSAPLITTLANGHGRAWIGLTATNYSAWWISYTFNDTEVKFAGGGAMPDIGNPDINDWGNTVTLPQVAGVNAPPTVLMQFFEGDPSCWPQCPAKGVVIAVSVDGSAAQTLPLDARACDGLGGCGAFSSGIASTSSGVSMRLYVLSAAGLLLAFDATNATSFAVPLWTYNMSTNVYDAPIYLPVVTDMNGTVYASCGSSVAALDASGALLWTYKLQSPVPGVPVAILSQPAFGCDGSIYVSAATHVKHAPTVFHLIAL